MDYSTSQTLSNVMGYVMTLVMFWLLFKLVRWLFSGPQPSPQDAIRRWQGVVAVREEEPHEFYGRFSARVKSKLDRPDLPLHKLSFGHRRLLSTRAFPRSLFAVKPTYMKVSFSHFSYYVFAVSTPGGLFISSWAFSSRVSIAAMNDPFWMMKLRELLRKETLFEYDVAALFAHFMHETLMEVVDQYAAEHKLPPLTPAQRRPVMGDDYAMPAELANAAMLSLDVASSGIASAAVLQNAGWAAPMPPIPSHGNSGIGGVMAGIGHHKVTQQTAEEEVH